MNTLSEGIIKRQRHDDAFNGVGEFNLMAYDG